MPATKFSRDTTARRYAESHLETDPGIVSVYFLPKNAGEREIRFLEVNELLGERNDDALEPIDFGVDAGMQSAHKLLVLDVTPGQWQRIQKQELCLPHDWSLEGAIKYKKK